MSDSSTCAHIESNAHQLRTHLLQPLPLTFGTLSAATDFVEKTFGEVQV